MIQINPVYKKELKQSARSKKTAIMIFIYNGFLALFVFFAFYLTFEKSAVYAAQSHYADILITYRIILGIEFLLVLYIVPVITAYSIAGERERQTLDILRTTALTNSQIIHGKLAASISMILLLTCSSLPIIGIIFSVGGVTFQDIFELFLMQLACSVFVGSLGILLSCICKKTILSIVTTYCVLLVIIIGLPLLIYGPNIMEHFKSSEMLYATMNGTIEVEHRNEVLLLLVNPLFTFLSILNRNYAISGDLFMYLDKSNPIIYIVTKEWYYISVIIQGILSIIFLQLAKIFLGKDS